MNKNNLIKIKTPVGITNEFQTGENVTQGSVGGGLISSINLDIPIRHFFSESEYEVNYGNVQMGPIIYQGDPTRLPTSVSSATAGISMVESCMETKMLNLHKDKSCYICLEKVNS